MTGPVSAPIGFTIFTSAGPWPSVARSTLAVIEVVSPGTKGGRFLLDTFARTMVDFLQAGIHLLIVDLFPPSRRDPQGMHKVIWDRVRDEPFMLPPDKPLTVAAY